jgi:phosphotransferase system HPr-like phosphotransfer protein
MEIKAFPTLDVLGSATGYLMSDISGVYKVLSFAAGEDVYTHQLPRVSKEFAAHLKTYRPDLLPCFDEAERVTPENFKAIGADWVARFGEAIEVRCMGKDEHARINPLSELVERVHPDKIVVVQAKSGEGEP